MNLIPASGHMDDYMAESEEVNFLEFHPYGQDER